MRRHILDSQTSLWKVGKATGSRWTGVTPKPARDPAGARPPGPPGPGQRSLEVGAPCKTRRRNSQARKRAGEAEDVAIPRAGREEGGRSGND